LLVVSDEWLAKLAYFLGMLAGYDRWLACYAIWQAASL